MFHKTSSSPEEPLENAQMLHEEERKQYVDIWNEYNDLHNASNMLNNSLTHISRRTKKEKTTGINLIHKSIDIVDNYTNKKKRLLHEISHSITPLNSPDKDFITPFTNTELTTINTKTKKQPITNTRHQSLEFNSYPSRNINDNNDLSLYSESLSNPNILISNSVIPYEPYNSEQVQFESSYNDAYSDLYTVSGEKMYPTSLSRKSSFCSMFQNSLDGDLYDTNTLYGIYSNNSPDNKNNSQPNEYSENLHLNQNLLENEQYDSIFENSQNIINLNHLSPTYKESKIDTNNQRSNPTIPDNLPNSTLHITDEYHSNSQPFSPEVQFTSLESSHPIEISPLNKTNLVNNSLTADTNSNTLSTDSIEDETLSMNHNKFQIQNESSNQNILMNQTSNNNMNIISMSHNNDTSNSNQNDAFIYNPVKIDNTHNNNNQVSINNGMTNLAYSNGIKDKQVNSEKYNTMQNITSNEINFNINSVNTSNTVNTSSSANTTSIANTPNTANTPNASNIPLNVSSKTNLLLNQSPVNVTHHIPIQPKTQMMTNNQYLYPYSSVLSEQGNTGNYYKYPLRQSPGRTIYNRTTYSYHPTKYREAYAIKWCHQCKARKRNVIDCRNNGKHRQPGSVKCVRSYCDKCLQKHYNLNIDDLRKLKDGWLCPGCTNTCSCAACIRKRYKDPREIPAEYQEKRNSRFFTTNKKLILEIKQQDKSSNS